MNKHTEMDGPAPDRRPLWGEWRKGRMDLLRRCQFSSSESALALALVLLLSFAFSGFAANDDSFKELRVGDQIYQNVRVTTKARNYILIVHARGISSIKVSDLSPEVLQQLGYPPPARLKTEVAKAWARQAVAKADIFQPKKVEAKLAQTWRGFVAPLKERMHRLKLWQVVVAALFVLLPLYALHCGCCWLICRKTGHEPGVLVWVPLLQVFPLLRAAAMPAWWFFALFIPLLNIAGYVLWCARIVQARGKPRALVYVLAFPLTSFLAFLYLALSRAAPRQTETPESGLLNLVKA